MDLPFHKMLPAQLSKGIVYLQAQSNFKMKQLACRFSFFLNFGTGGKMAIALGPILDLAELG
jgi:hypothetical protein